MGAMIVIALIAVSVSLATQSILSSAVTRKGIENRVEVSLIAESVLNAVATTSVSGVNEIATSDLAGVWLGKSLASFAWLGAWERAGAVRNIELRLSAFQIQASPTPSFSPVPFPSPSPSPSPSPLSADAHQIELKLEYSKDTGRTWQPFTASKWVAR